MSWAGGATSRGATKLARSLARAASAACTRASRAPRCVAQVRRWRGGGGVFTRGVVPRARVDLTCSRGARTPSRAGQGGGNQGAAQGARQAHAREDAGEAGPRVRLRRAAPGMPGRGAARGRVRGRGRSVNRHRALQRGRPAAVLRGEEEARTTSVRVSTRGGGEGEKHRALTTPCPGCHCRRAAVSTSGRSRTSPSRCSGLSRRATITVRASYLLA